MVGEIRYFNSHKQEDNVKKFITLGRPGIDVICHIELVYDEKGNRLVDYNFNIKRLCNLLAVDVKQCQIIDTIFNNRVCRFNKLFNTNIVFVSTTIKGPENLLIAIRLKFQNQKSEIDKFTNYLIQYFDPEDDIVLDWLYQTVRCARAARYDIMESAFMDDGILDKGGQKYIDYVKRLLGEALKALTIPDEDFKKRVDDILEKHKTTLDEVTIDNKIIKV